MTTWREEIEEEMEGKDSFDNVVFSTLTEEQLNEKFNGSYGIEQGIPFLLWTKTRVYFPVSRAGAEWVGSVPRDPSEYEDLGYF